MSHLLCLGLGYAARVLAARLASEGWRITGTSRTAQGAALLRDAGFAAIVYDGTAPSPALASVLGEATHLLASAPPSGDGDPMLRHHDEDVSHAPSLGWIGYLSTVGVYGDRAGEWVDEKAEPRPGSERARLRLVAETQWQDIGAWSGAVVQVFRLPGIYGPGRSVVDRLVAGTAKRIVKPGQVFNRVHVADIAGVLQAAIARGGPPGIFNVTDDEPAPAEDVMEHAARLLGIAPPPAEPFETADLSDMALSFYSEARRVTNSRIKEVLGVSLAYPTYREGLAAIVAELRK